MIIKARARAGGSQLAAYLLNRDGSERAELVEMRGFYSDSLKNSLIGAEIEGKASECEKALYHASFRLEDGAHLTPEQWKEAADRLEKNLHLENHARAIVMHEQDGQEHMHVVWSRLDDETLAPARLSNDWYICKATARELERDFGTRQLSNYRTNDDRQPTRGDFEKAKREGRNIQDIKAEIRECWENSDNGASFQNALQDAGYILAQGDRRDFVVIDLNGQDYTIGKRITGAKAADIRQQLADLDKGLLPTVDEAREYQAEQQRQHEQARADQAREQQQKAEQARAEPLPDCKAAAQEITKPPIEGKEWPQKRQQAANMARANEKGQDETQAPKGPNVGRAAADLGEVALNVIGGLAERLAGPITYEEIKQQARHEQTRAAQYVQNAAEQLKQPLAHDQREMKGREFQDAAAKAEQAREGYREATQNAAAAQAPATRKREFDLKRYHRDKEYRAEVRAARAQEKQQARPKKIKEREMEQERERERERERDF